ncbi:hypothetical protein BJ166DRAFT_598007 [Pestalotiopsis sp. NC0098]|nr:hypothetical protein BJ166DRAFT_598007 [Pestalotiopsis sp. NC0098]
MSQETPHLSSSPTTDQNAILTKPDNPKNKPLRDSMLKIVLEDLDGKDTGPEMITSHFLNLSNRSDVWKTCKVLLGQELIFLCVLYPEAGTINVRYKMDVFGHGRSLTEMRLSEMILATYIESGGKVEDLRHVTFWHITDGPTRDSIEAISTRDQRYVRPLPEVTPLDSKWEAFASQNDLVQSVQELAEILSGPVGKAVSIPKVQMLESRSGSTYDLAMIVELQHE